MSHRSFSLSEIPLLHDALDFLYNPVVAAINKNITADSKNHEGLSREELTKKIRSIKDSRGKSSLILAHHYQREEIVCLADFRGDSLELARIASTEKEARDIILCGVHFMAESAAILCHDHQRVFLPDSLAGCPMANMAVLKDVETAHNTIVSICGSGSVIPIAYMNTTAPVKAFCGKGGGSICTSSNASRIFKWALASEKKILFVPDEQLGRNTSNLVDIPREKVILWNPCEPRGGNSIKEIKSASAILWKGHCYVHTHFTPEHVKTMRARFPDAHIISHPECSEEVINLSDRQGSTSFIEKFVHDAPEGSTIIIGTEINFVSRLARENPGKRILELSHSLCTDMSKIDLKNLYCTLLNMSSNNRITVSPEIEAGASLALEQMLKLC